MRFEVMNVVAGEHASSAGPAQEIAIDIPIERAVCTLI
jgi:hypothetical protein